MKTKEMVIFGAILMFPSTFSLWVIAMLVTGEAKFVFQGQFTEIVSNKLQENLDRRDDKTDSLIVEQSRAYIAKTKELKRIEAASESLTKEQSRLETMRQELKREREALEEERKKFEKVLADAQIKDEGRIKKLAKTYGAMKAKEAARIMTTLDDSLCLDIFKYMSEDRQKAKILSAMPGAKAARLSKKMGVRIKS